MKKSALLLLVAVLFLAVSCSQEKEYIQFPADTLAKEMDQVQNYSIILYDMNMTEDGKFQHKYKIIKQPDNIPTPEELVAREFYDSSVAVLDSAANQQDSTAMAQNSVLADSSVTAQEVGFEETITDWKEISEADFDYYSSDMGMEIYSKVDGQLHKVSAPPGYNHYVGNEKYGQWRTDNSGNSFWAFYGRYMFMSTMLHMMMPVRYGYYSSYGAYRYSRPYYGPSNNGRYAYGTGSAHANRVNPNFNQRMNSNSKFASRVNNSVAKSSSRANKGQRTAATRQRTSRSSSRYSRNGSRARSFGGGGK